MARAHKSVRVRITAAATVVVALALALAGWALVATVEHGLEQDVANQSKKQIAFVSSQLADGVDPSHVVVEPGTGIVQVFEGSQLVGPETAVGTWRLFAAPGVSGAGAETVDVPVGSGAFGTAGVAGSPAVAPFDVRYDTVSVNGDQLTVVAASPLADVERSISTLKGSLAVGFPFVVALVGAVAWAVTGRALRPVEAIRAEVEEISASTMHRRVPEPGGRDEVDRLAHTMNAMLDRLEDGATRQRRFVADASHELRSPIAAMRTQLEVAQRHPDSADWPQVATSVLAEERRLEGLVTDLLALALDDEGAPPPGAVVDLTDVVTEEAHRARAKPVEVDADAVTVHGDRSALQSLVAHLLDNAARHAQSRVEVRLHAEGDDAVLTVDDDGTGIAEADRERVFDRFTRLDEGRSRDQGGAGLGLAVVRAIASRHHGTVRAESSPLGGARLAVTLRRSASGESR
jgi:signal transduction histidine kinase